MKNGIDFFPLDVYLDEKFELIEAEFGLTGFAVIVKLLQRIYGQQGYYCEWTNEVALLFGKQTCLGGNAVSEIVSASIKRGIFDKTLYDKYQILTSVGIQKRYFEIVSRRKNVEVKSEYLLVCASNFSINVNKNDKNVNISKKNADISRQSKVKESKEKERDTHAGFFDKYGIKIDNDYSYLNMDFEKLENRMQKSEWLRNYIKCSSALCKIYDKIIIGQYDDYNSGNAQKFGNEHQYTKEDFNNVFTNIEEVEI